VAVRWRRPTEKELAGLLERSRADALSYEPIGGSLGGPTPSALRRRRWSTVLQGAGAFARGVEALRAWQVHRGAGLEVATDGPIAVGTNVALSTPLPLGFVDATCRIVAVVDEPDRFGFAYGTLSVHPEQGEEAFLVVRDEEGSVRFDVEAVSRPIHPLARVLPLFADRLQDAAVRRYLSAMEHSVAP
jgi:uncharacterized protein (UPF0548 family)